MHARSKGHNDAHMVPSPLLTTPHHEGHDMPVTITRNGKTVTLTDQEWDRVTFSTLMGLTHLPLGDVRYNSTRNAYDKLNTLDK